MAIYTQVRLAQVTGSLTSIKPGSIAKGTAIASLSNANIPDAEAIFGYFGQAIANIIGNTDFGSQNPGLIEAQNGDNYDLELRQNDAGQRIVLAAPVGTGNGAIHLTASEGGINIVAPKSGKGVVVEGDFVAITGSNGGPHSVQLHSPTGGVDISSGNGGLTAVKIVASSGGVYVKAANAGPDAIFLDASAGGIMVDATAAGKAFDLTANNVWISGSAAGSDAVFLRATGGGVDISAADMLEMSSSNSSLRSQFVTTAEGQILLMSASGAGAGLLGLSGTVVFSAPGHEWPQGSGMAFASVGGGNDEFLTFRNQSVFTKTTTVIGAFNALADSVASSEPTLFVHTLNGNVNAGNNVVLTKLAGDAANLIKTVGDNKAQVFVNGQLLRSSSGGTTQDYAITANNTIQFQFDLKIDDVVQAMDFS